MTRWMKNVVPTPRIPLRYRNSQVSIFFPFYRHCDISLRCRHDFPDVLWRQIEQKPKLLEEPWLLNADKKRSVVLIGMYCKIWKYNNMLCNLIQCYTMIYYVTILHTMLYTMLQCYNITLSSYNLRKYRGNLRKCCIQ